MSISTQKKRIEAGKNGGRDRKTFAKLMNSAVHGKNMENLTNRIDIRLVSNENDYLKWTTKPSYMSQKLFDNDLIAIRKIKVTLTLNELAQGDVYIKFK